MLTCKLRSYYILTKPEVNLLILMTTSAGYYLANHGPLNIRRLISTLVGTLLVASGTATLNQWIERVWDGQMRRTASRPLPSGRVSAGEAFALGIFLSISGCLYLLLAVNGLSALLALSTLLSYLLLYTPLKRKTPLLYSIGSVSRRRSNADWLGWSSRVPQPSSLVSFCHSLPLAVSPFSRHRSHVSR